VLVPVLRQALEKQQGAMKNPETVETFARAYTGHFLSAGSSFEPWSTSIIDGIETVFVNKLSAHEES